MRIGEFLVSKGVITPVQVQAILNHSRETGLRFGEAGMATGHLTSEKLLKVFGPHWQTDFFHLDPAYFPKTTRDLFTPDEMARFGLAPLAFKTVGGFFSRKKVLNVGMLDPVREPSLAVVRARIQEKLGSQGVTGFKTYLILADQLIELLRLEYGITPEQLRSRPHGELDPLLSLFLETSPAPSRS